MLHDLLTQKRDTILRQWAESIIDTYPPDTSRFLKSQKDRFQNPVGYAIETSLCEVYDQLLSESDMDPDRLMSALDSIVRIRSVQEFSPSQAVAFVFKLKQIVRKRLNGQLQDKAIFDQLADFDSRVDRVVLLAFDKYMSCREKINEIRTNEARMRSHQLLQRVNRLEERHGNKENSEMISDDKQNMRGGDG